MNEYQLPVYGQDMSLYPREKVYNIGQGIFPVFGVKTGDDAWFAIIEEGDAVSTIRAKPASSSVPLSSAYTEFRIREKQQTKIEFNANTMTVYQVSRYQGNYTVDYRFLMGDQANYSGMAKCYQSYLFGDRKPQRDKDQPLYVELLGSITDKKST